MKNFWGKTIGEFGNSEFYNSRWVYLFAIADVTNYYIIAWNNTKLSSHSSAGQNSDTGLTGLQSRC